MRLVSYWANRKWRAGIWLNGSVVDTAEAARVANLSRGMLDGWDSNRRIVRAEEGELRALEASARALQSDGGSGDGIVVPLMEVRLGPPIPDPEKIICLGLNYVEHAEESDLDVPEAPVLFAKFRNSLVGQAEPIVLPRASERVDYEGELAVVIGRRCREVSEEEALDYVAGYMPLNDVSARDLQLQTSQWLAGKAVDTFAPCGPALVLADEVEDPQDLGIETRVNGETVQRANTSMMIFSVRETVSFVSRVMTLEPGDIIATGTPSGVGQSRNPPLFLKDGDVVEVEIGGLGTLHNPVVRAGCASVAVERTTRKHSEAGQG